MVGKVCFEQRYCRREAIRMTAVIPRTDVSHSRPVRSGTELLEVLESLKSRVMIAGIYDEYPQAL